MAQFHCFQMMNWNLEMLGFVDGGKLLYPEKNPQSRDENQQQTQPTYGCRLTPGFNQTQATLLGGEFFHYCTTPAAHVIKKIQKFHDIIVDNLCNSRYIGISVL